VFKRNDCKDCGKELGIKSFWKNSKRCRECNYKFEIGENNHNFKHGETLKKHYCKCDEEICYNNYIDGNKMCKSCATKERFKDPKDNPFYVHGRGREPYSIEFTEQLKESIRKRDNYECQNCGMTEEEHLIVWGQVLHVHHIDYNKKNCEENNLITTCHQCNLRANSNRTYWQNYYNIKILTTIKTEKE
jgi:hypothetical protein